MTRAIGLARRRVPCFSGASVFHRNTKWFVAASRGLAGLLAGALLVFELLAGDGQLHQAFHDGAKGASNTCLLCLFATGHVDLSDTMPVVATYVRQPVKRLLQTETTPLLNFRYLCSPSRAPPVLSSFRPVVA